MNKGFSLVELIVVIAIMAILVGVAVPVYTSYITKAEQASDIQAIDNLEHACKIVGIEYTVTINFDVAADATTIVATVGTNGDSDSEKAFTQLKAVLGDSIVTTAAEGKIVADEDSNTLTLTLKTKVGGDVKCPADINA